MFSNNQLNILRNYAIVLQLLQLYYIPEGRQRSSFIEVTHLVAYQHLDAKALYS